MAIRPPFLYGLGCCTFTWGSHGYAEMDVLVSLEIKCEMKILGFGNKDRVADIEDKLRNYFWVCETSTTRCGIGGECQ